MNCMWWTWVLKFFVSKEGKVLIAVLILLGIFAGYRWKISSLEGKIDRLTVEKANAEIRNKLCQADIQGLQVSVEVQNQKVSELERTNRELTIASSQSAQEEITNPDDIEIEVKEGSGPDALDSFMEERFGD